MTKELLTANEVAGVFKKPVASIYAWAREGRLPGVVRVGRSIRFDADKIEEFIANGGRALPGGWRQEAR